MSTRRPPGEWILRPRPQRHPTVRLFCFPAAGGGASMFARWFEDLPATVEVCCLQPPGRESRSHEPSIDRLDEFVEAVGAHIVALADAPFAFFGHSMGALLGFEAARYLRRAHGLTPAHLFVSAHRACHLPSRFAPMHALPDAALLHEIAFTYQGMPQAILNDAEFVAAWLPIFRGDLTILENYVYRAEDPLPCPVSAFGGSLDVAVSRDELTAWREQTHEAFQLRVLAGDHFYFRTLRLPLLTAIAADLARTLRRSLFPVAGDAGTPRGYPCVTTPQESIE